MSEAKCEVCGRVAWRQGMVSRAAIDGSCEMPFFGRDDDCLRLGYTRANERIREAKHLISVRMEGFPCADLDDCENLKTLQAIAASLEGKEI